MTICNPYSKNRIWGGYISWNHLGYPSIPWEFHLVCASVASLNALNIWLNAFQLCLPSQATYAWEIGLVWAPHRRGEIKWLQFKAQLQKLLSHLHSHAAEEGPRNKRGIQGRGEACKTSAVSSSSKVPLHQWYLIQPQLKTSCVHCEWMSFFPPI